jgi:hypothetical protein
LGWPDQIGGQPNLKLTALPDSEIDQGADIMPRIVLRPDDLEIVKQSVLSDNDLRGLVDQSTGKSPDGNERVHIDLSDTQSERLHDLLDQYYERCKSESDQYVWTAEHNPDFSYVRQGELELRTTKILRIVEQLSFFSSD